MNENNKNDDNIYKELIKTKPALIICSDHSELDQTAKETLNERIKLAENVFCEIGSGSGEHLLKLAMQNPKNFYVGLELRYKRIFRTAEKAETYGLKNLVVIRHDAKKIADLFPAGRLKGVFVNFPDPWSGKRRWEKHRLLTEEYLDILEKLLGPGGFFSYKTDHQQRFLQICDILKNHKILKLEKLTHDMLNSEFYKENIPTEFERLFVKKQLPIYFLYANKV